MEHTLTYWQVYLLELGKIILYWELCRYVVGSLWSYSKRIYSEHKKAREANPGLKYNTTHMSDNH